MFHIYKETSYYITWKEAMIQGEGDPLDTSPPIIATDTTTLTIIETPIRMT